MKQIDLDLKSPIIQNDANATRMLAAYTAKIKGILQQLADESGKIRVLDAAPAAGELSTIGDNLGNVFSEVAILDDSTQSDRKIYYKNKAGTVRLIDSA